MHDLRGRDDPCRPAVSAQQVVADPHLAHGRPAVRRGERGVERERLPDRRTSGHDDHLAGVEAVGQLVQIGEPCRHANHRPAAGADRFDLVERALHDLRERQVVLAGPLVGDGVDLGLGGVDDVVDLAVGGVPHLRDPRPRLDQPAQRGPLTHDPCVVAGVGRGRNRGDEGVQVRPATGAADLAALGQLGGHGHRVGRLAATVQISDRVIDQLVRRFVEVGGPQRLDDVGDRVLGEHHAAEHALFRGDVLGRGALELRRP